MALKICRRGGGLIGEVSFDYGKVRRVAITPLLVLGEDVDRLLKPLVARLKLLAPNSVVGYLGQLRWLGDGLVALGITRLPRDEVTWQQLVLGIHRFVFTRADRKVTLQIRNVSYWLGIRGFFVTLAEDGLIPVSVDLPPVRGHLNSVDIGPYQARLLGQRPPQVVTDGALDKLLVSVSLARTDAAYLEEIRDTLAFRRRILLDALSDYWSRLKTNYEFGQSLLASVDWPRLKAELETHQNRTPHPANPFRGREGLASYLAVCRNIYDGCVHSKPAVTKILKARGGKRYLPTVESFAPLFGPEGGLDLPPNFAGRYRTAPRQTVLWWLGQIVTLDVVMICALLIMLHPSWTPYSLLRARLLNKEGKLFLNFTDRGMVFAIEKTRAKAMKTERLTDLSVEILTTLIAMSAPLRERLKAQRDPRASLLFLPFGNQNNNVSVVGQEMGSRMLGGPNGVGESVWIGEVYPELVAQGLGIGTVSFSKIRHTEGVLEWFRTQSLKAVSRKLGNTQKVVLQHYLPQPLLDAWNTRMLRRFQNLWIATAAANEDFLLEVTDFANRADLHAFLVDMLQLHSRTSSPLAEVLHDRFGGLRGEAAKRERPEGHLHISISKGSLLALYAYQASVLDAGLPRSALDQQDVVTGLSPRHFLTLADLLHASLPKDKNPAVKAAHDAALQIASDATKRPKWGRLFIA